MSCRICLEPVSDSRRFIQPCNCTGHLGNVHKRCLQQWINVRRSPTCELCRTTYDTTLVQIPYTTPQQYQLYSLAGLGCCLSLLICYSIWLQRLFQLLSPGGSWCLNLCFTLFQIMIWAFSLHFRRSLVVVFMPPCWFVLLVLSNNLVMSILNNWTWDSLVYGTFGLNGLCCSLMFFSSCCFFHRR